MEFKKWIELNKYTYQQVADKLFEIAGKNITASMVYKWANYRRMPKLNNMAHISKLTHGRVKAEDFIK